MYRMHREGHLPVVLAFFVLLMLVVLIYWVLPVCCKWVGHLGSVAAVVLFGFILHFFRDPVVIPTQDPNAVLAPCQGKVVLIQEVNDTRYFHRPMRQVSIFMSPLNVHVNRTPVAGRVAYVEYTPGQYLVAWHPKSSELNEHTYIVVEGPHGRVAFKQIAGAVARRIIHYLAKGDSVTQGQEFGFIRFGSRCDVLFPLEWLVTTQVGDLTEAGVSIIAKVTR